MQLIFPDKNTFPLISKYIQRYEEKCIFLASHIRRHSKNLYIISNSGKANDIQGIIYLDSSLFHLIPNLENINAAELFSLIRQKQETKIKCISGEAKGTEFFKNLLKEVQGEAYQTNHYKLMTADQTVNPPEELANDDQIIRCTEADIDLLFPIQKKYLTEEVAPFGKTVTDAEVSIGLRQTLKNQLCLALYSNGEIVAKANTNAIGINWIQLGGVYTDPLYRRNGYAWHLISAICRRTSKAGKKSALFVKDINVPAMELYKKLGFKDSGLYEIAYF